LVSHRKYKTGLSFLKKITGAKKAIEIAPASVIGHAADTCTHGKPARQAHQPPFVSQHPVFKKITVIKSLAQLLGLAANDFWYPSMRRPPNPTAAKRLPAPLAHTTKLRVKPKSVPNH
jgi:hypothetical protein